MKNQQPVSIGIAVFLLLSLIACSTPIPTLSTISTATLPIPSPTVKTPSAPQCVTEKVDLNELANATLFREYRWSTDGQTIYVQTDDGWWAYSASDRKITPASGPEILVTPTLSALEQIHRSIVKAEYWTPQYQSSLSPSGTRLIYWEKTKELKSNDPNRLKTPTVTPDPWYSGDGEVVVSEEKIFLLQNETAEPIYIGTVMGAITNAYWLPGEQRVVLKMLELSPDFLWLLDIPSQTLTPLLSQEDLPGARKLGLWGISPDGNWAMYQTNSYHFTILNINTTDRRELYEIQRTPGAWWTPDSKRILIVANAGPGYYSIYIYDMALDKFTRLISDLEKEGSFRLVSISDNQAVLANISTNYYSRTHQISVLYLCWDN